MVWLSVPPSKSFVQFKGQDVPATRDQEYNEVARAALVRPHGPYHLVDLYELFQGEQLLFSLSQLVTTLCFAIRSAWAGPRSSWF